MSSPITCKGCANCLERTSTGELCVRMSGCACHIDTENEIKVVAGLDVKTGLKFNPDSLNIASPPSTPHSMKCPKLYGENCQCDGYHTFDELYEHRIVLYIALCKRIHNLESFISDGRKFGMISYPVTSIWCSTKHSDGSSFGDWFILGIRKEKGYQITYHLPARFWNEVCGFAEVLEKAPEWDGHTSDDVLERLKTL